MRKYVINYSFEAYNSGRITHSEFIEGVACYGLKELNVTLSDMDKSNIDYIDILSSDGENAYSLGTRKFKR